MLTVKRIRRRLYVARSGHGARSHGGPKIGIAWRRDDPVRHSTSYSQPLDDIESIARRTRERPGTSWDEERIREISVCWWGGIPGQSFGCRSCEF